MTTEKLHVHLDIKALADDGSFEGYASSFDNPDQGRDVMRKGAFKSSLAKRPANTIKMFRDHDPGQLVGVWTDLKEDARGLFAKGRLILETVLGRETHALMKAGALDGLSIGFKTIKDSFDREKRLRFLDDVDLREISIVAFPMNERATVTAIKSGNADQARRIIAALNRATDALSQRR